MPAKCFLLPLFMVIGLFSFSQTFIGKQEIINYTKQQYNAGAQNWAIRQDAEGRMYFANNEGVLVFDGTYWHLHPLPNKTIVRSIEFGNDKRLYVGAQDEIGYFSPAKNGQLLFTSLKNLLPESEQKFSDVWNIVNFGEEVFFRSYDKILKYANNKLIIYPSASSWRFLGISHHQLIAHDAKKGLLMYKNGLWATFIENNLLPKDFDITDINEFGTDSSLITTSNKGLYLLIGNKLSKFALLGLDKFAGNHFSNAVQSDHTEFLVGTYWNGLYEVKKNGQVVENFSKREGLQNSNIRSIFMDKNHNVWLGLDNGIDFIAYHNAIKNINPSVFNDGAGYSVAKYSNSLYFALSNGVYQLPLQQNADLSYTKNNFSMFASGQNWNLSVVNNKLFVGRDDGLFQIKEGNTLLAISSTTGFWGFQPFVNSANTAFFVAGNYYGVRLFKQNGNNFEDKGNLSTYNGSSRFVAVENNNIWVSHPYRGIYKINSLDSTFKIYTQANGLPSTLDNHIYKIKNRVVAATEKGIYEYNIKTDAFEPSVYFKAVFGDKSLRYLKEDPAGNIWFVQEKSIGVADFSTGKPSVIYLPELKGNILSGFENIYSIDENNIFVGGEKGFYHIDYEKYKLNRYPLSVFIRTVKTTANNIDSLLFGGYYGQVNDKMGQTNGNRFSLKHQFNSFHFEFSAPIFGYQSNIEYRYLLEGFDKEWSDWSKKTEKDYTNLPTGNYFFRVMARNNLNNESPIDSYAFAVLPPWYQTVWAYFFYCLLLCVTVYILIKQQEIKQLKRQEKRVLAERQKHEEEQKQLVYHHQLELEKSDNELMQLKNEKLEAEIEFKTTELASIAMNLVQKKEFILKVRDNLQHLNTSGKDLVAITDLKKILRTLSDDEKLNTEWEQFSIHFNKVHGDFLTILKEKYPTLKPHELQLSAYLRMNLSTKEIAQLMSISVRGVEISRYRLRKKLSIATEVNLFQFLFDLKRTEKTDV